MRDYEAIIAEFDRQREDAAQSIFRLAEALRRLGRIEEARVQYARILREFVDFPELARLSQQQLSQNAANQFPTGAANPPHPASPEERPLLKEELGLLEEQLARTKDLIKQGLASEASMFPVQRDILHVKQQLARLAAASRHAAGSAETNSNASPARWVPKTPFPRIEGSAETGSNTRPVVAVVGSISQPGVVDFRPGMKICDAITERGGPDRRGDASRVRLTRGGESRDLDLSDIPSHPENNVELEPGDSIIVLPAPRSKKPSTADATTSPATDPSPTTPARR